MYFLKKPHLISGIPVIDIPWHQQLSFELFKSSLLQDGQFKIKKQSNQLYLVICLRFDRYISEIVDPFGSWTF